MPPAPQRDRDAPYRQASAEYLDAVTAQDFARWYKELSYRHLAVRAGVRVLDVGCGTGDDVRALAALVGPAGRRVGIDFREDIIAEARRRTDGTGLPATFEVADACQLPFPDASFEGCRADRVFQHLEEPSRALGEMLRVARPGGRVVLADPDWDTITVDMPEPALTRRPLQFLCDRTRRGQMGRQLYGLFRAAGLRDVVVVPVAMVITDLALAKQLAHLERVAGWAREAGAIAAEADRAGRFFSSMTGLLVSGSKP